jgi:hypothetical protein
MEEICFILLSTFSFEPGIQPNENLETECCNREEYKERFLQRTTIRLYENIARNRFL